VRVIHTIARVSTMFEHYNSWWAGGGRIEARFWQNSTHGSFSVHTEVVDCAVSVQCENRVP
jgi:hypothetical protein